MQVVEPIYTPETTGPATHKEQTVCSGNSEAITVVRRTLEESSELDRQLMVLFYGGGLDTRVIANEVSLPRISVAARIDETLRRIRTGLRELDPVNVDPAVHSSDIFHAICDGDGTPPHLYRRVVAIISRMEKANALSGTLPAKTRALIWIGALLAVGASILAIWQFTARG